MVQLQCAPALLAVQDCCMYPCQHAGHSLIESKAGQQSLEATRQPCCGAGLLGKPFATCIWMLE